MSGDDTYVLKNRRRRAVMEALCEEEEMSMVGLANAITGDDESPASVFPELYDCHLSLLVERGFVAYDEELGTVTLAKRPEDVREALGAE